MKYHASKNLQRKNSTLKEWMKNQLAGECLREDLIGFFKMTSKRRYKL
jgi:hypothetical protein